MQQGISITNRNTVAALGARLDAATSWEALELALEEHFELQGGDMWKACNWATSRLSGPYGAAMISAGEVVYFSGLANELRTAGLSDHANLIRSLIAPSREANIASSESGRIPPDKGQYEIEARLGDMILTQESTNFLGILNTYTAAYVSAIQKERNFAGRGGEADGKYVEIEHHLKESANIFRAKLFTTRQSGSNCLRRPKEASGL